MILITHNMYIRKKKMRKWAYYVIEDRIKTGKAYKTSNIRYLGTAEKVLSDLEELDTYRRIKS